MKKAVLLILMIALLMCAGCAGVEKADEKALEIRTKYLECQQLTLTAEITADYGDRVYDYAVSYTGDGATGVIDIEKPLDIAGISVILEEDGPRLSCDGAMLDTGPLWTDGLSPAEALPLMIGAWRGGWISSARRETLDGSECVVLEICPAQGGDEDTLICTWFYEDTMEPAAAELFSDGVSVIRCVFTNDTEEQ